MSRVLWKFFMQKALWWICAAGTIAAAVAIVSGGGCNAAEAIAGGPNWDRLDGVNLRRHCSVLAADAFEGRQAGSRGGQAAAAYLVSELKKLAVTPAATRQDFRQDFGVDYANILAALPGADPVLKQEWIVLGAHYDHVGYGNRTNSHGPIGQIHNGADDNASGVSLVLELAAWLAEGHPRSRRSVLFAFWDAEEAGLLGSQHWIKQPTISLDRVKLAINLDMVGRMRQDRVAVTGWRTAAGLRQRLVQANVAGPLCFDFGSKMTADSDHYSFFTARCPTLHFDTGQHADYHRPSDDVEKLNWTGMERLGQLVGRFVAEAANADTLPTFRMDVAGEAVSVAGDRNVRLPAPVRLGVSWDPTEVSERGRFQVLRVVPGTPAAKAGLQPGDQLLELAHQRPHTLSALRALLNTADSHVEMAWLPVRSNDSQRKMIELQGEPVRMGFKHRLDAAQPGCAVITGVIEDSPADVVGLEPGDVLMQIGPGTESVVDAMSRPWPAQSASIPLIVDRDGRLIHIDFTVH